MKNDIQKSMRKIRNQLKLHTNNEYEKAELRGYLKELKKMLKVKNMDIKVQH